MKKVSIALSILLGLSSLANACGSKHKKSNEAVPLPKATQYFVHGDPKEMLIGTVADNKGLTAMAGLESFNNFRLSNMIDFAQAIEKEKVKAITSQEDLEEENDTSESSEPFDSNYAFVQNGSDYLYVDPRPEAKDWPTLRFAEENGVLVVKELSGFAAKPVHYSVKTDGNAFSVLLEVNDDSGLHLIALYFVKTKTERLATRLVASEANYFISGDGKALPWKSDIKFSLCGKNAVLYKSSVDTAMFDWSKAGDFESGKIGKLNYSVDVKTSARPFSDLNQNCVSFIDNYKMEDQDNTGIMGITLPIVDVFNQEIINSQIFIFNRALRRFNEPTQPTVTHEIGHALGLGHKFDDFDNNPFLSSIMAYQDNSVITAADSATIKNLYPIDEKNSEELIPSLFGR